MGTSLYVDFADHLRQEIIDRVVVPGQRLPMRVDLKKRFEPTPMTLNRFHVALRDKAAKLQAEERRILPFYDKVASHTKIPAEFSED